MLYRAKYDIKQKYYLQYVWAGLRRLITVLILQVTLCWMMFVKIKLLNIVCNLVANSD